jgi:hypothetical protein
MDLLQGIDGRNINWATPAIHAYALVVLCLALLVYFVHRWRLADLARRISTIADHVEGRHAAVPARVDVDQLTGLILHLGDVVSRRADLDLAPILEFLRAEERRRQVSVVATLVFVTETMIDLFPVLGILGTVYAISGVGREDFSSDRLLVLFGVAVSTTLWALLYVLVFRIAYSAFIQSRVLALADQIERYREFLRMLELRSAAPAIAPATRPFPVAGRMGQA